MDTIADMGGMQGFGPVELTAPVLDPGWTTIDVTGDTLLEDDESMLAAVGNDAQETLPLLDVDEPTHALDVLTLVESILENPELILRRQLDQAHQHFRALRKLLQLEVQRELQLRLFPLRNVVLAPSEYHVYLHPDDFEHVRHVVPRIGRASP